MSVEIKGRAEDGSWNKVDVSDSGEMSVKIDSQTVNEPWDYYELVYVTAGNGIGEIESITYYTGTLGSGTQTLQLNFNYNADNNLESVERS